MGVLYRTIVNIPHLVSLSGCKEAAKDTPHSSFCVDWGEQGSGGIGAAGANPISFHHNRR